MTLTVILARLRAILNEATAGFWTDATDLYPFIDSGQNQTIQFLIGKIREMRKIDKFYENPSLTPLIKLDSANTTSIGATLQEYGVPNDFIETYRAEYSPNISTINRKEATLKTFGEIMDFERNIYTKGMIEKQSFYYIREKKIGFFPQPSGGGANGYQHYYYHQPAVIESGGALTLSSETHEAILNFAIADALRKDKQYSVSESAYNKAINILINL